MRDTRFACRIHEEGKPMDQRIRRSGQVYTHVLNKGGKVAVSPLDAVLG
jgi:hypothetical protein